MEVIFWNSKLIFTEKILMFIRENNSIWLKALSMPLTIWDFVWS